MKYTRIGLMLAFLVIISGLRAFETGRRPLQAAAMSLVIPGAGQIYNQQYLKAGVVGTTHAVFIGKVVYDTLERHRYHDKMNSSDVNYSYNKDRYDHFFDRQQADMWWLGTVMLVSSLDAYVDANLFNFDQKKKEVHLRFEGGMAMVSLEF